MPASQRVAQLQPTCDEKVEGTKDGACNRLTLCSNRTCGILRGKRPRQFREVTSLPRAWIECIIRLCAGQIPAGRRLLRSIMNFGVPERLRRSYGILALVLLFPGCESSSSEKMATIPLASI